MIPVCTCTIWRTDFLSQQAQNMIMPCMSQLLLLAFAGSASVDALPCCEMGDPEKERVARRCLSHTNAGMKCNRPELREYCPVTCGVCTLCPDHPRFEEYRRFGTLHATSYSVPKPSERSDAVLEETWLRGHADTAQTGLLVDDGTRASGVVASDVHVGAFVPTVANQSGQAEAFIRRGPSDAW